MRQVLWVHGFYRFPPDDIGHTPPSQECWHERRDLMLLCDAQFSQWFCVYIIRDDTGHVKNQNVHVLSHQAFAAKKIKGEWILDVHLHVHVLAPSIPLAQWRGICGHTIPPPKKIKIKKSLLLSPQIHPFHPFPNAVSCHLSKSNRAWSCCPCQDYSGTSFTNLVMICNDHKSYEPSPTPGRERRPISSRMVKSQWNALRQGSCRSWLILR